MLKDIAPLLASIAAALTAIDQISIIITTKRLWKQVRVRVKRDGLIGIRPAGGAHHKPKPKKPKPKKPKPEPKPMPPGHNGNRKKCKTCKWRGTGPIGCNYAAYHDRPRSAICTVEDCTVYEKGKPPRNHISI